MNGEKSFDVLDIAPRKILTLTFVEKEKDVLLGYKKRGFGKGLWNGFGGKVEIGEQIVEAAIREVEEECGLTIMVNDMDKVGVIHFEFLGDPVILEVHVFKSLKFSGEVQESDEMRPQWYPRDNVPHEQMWPDDEIWYPYYLTGKKFRGYFLFEGHTKILSYVLRDYGDPNSILKSKGRSPDLNKPS